MGTKILWQVESRLKGQLKPGMKETYLATRDFAQQVARPDTEIVMRFTEDAPTSNANHLICHSAITTVQMVHSIVEAEKEGFDAALSGVCAIDVWSRPCRQAVKIPVLGGLALQL